MIGYQAVKPSYFDTFRGGYRSPSRSISAQNLSLSNTINAYLHDYMFLCYNYYLCAFYSRNYYGEIRSILKFEKKIPDAYPQRNIDSKLRTGNNFLSFREGYSLNIQAIVLQL